MTAKCFENIRPIYRLHDAAERLRPVSVEKKNVHNKRLRKQSNLSPCIQGCAMCIGGRAPVYKARGVLYNHVPIAYN